MTKYPRSWAKNCAGMDEADDGSIECQPCRLFPGKASCTFMRSAIARHKDSVHHREALLKWDDQRERQQRRQIEQTRDLSAATLQPVRHSSMPSTFQDNVVFQDRRDDALAGTFVSNNVVYDGCGVPILLSAGRKETEQERMWRELDDLTTEDLFTSVNGAWYDPLDAISRDEDATRTNVDTALGLDQFPVPRQS